MDGKPGEFGGVLRRRRATQNAAIDVFFIIMDETFFEKNIPKHEAVSKSERNISPGLYISHSGTEAQRSFKKRERGNTKNTECIFYFKN